MGLYRVIYDYGRDPCRGVVGWETWREDGEREERGREDGRSLREGEDKLVMSLECERCLVAAAERKET